MLCEIHIWMQMVKRSRVSGKRGPTLRAFVAMLSCEIMSVFLLLACAPQGPTELCDGFRSYETPEEARNAIRSLSAPGEWKERTQFTDPADRRPPHQFLTMEGPFRLSGIEGRLTLTFYNDRLMETEFSTARGREFLTQFKEKVGNAPADAGQEITVGRRTRFRYDVISDGTFRFLWMDPELEDEWREWVRRYS